MTTGTDIDTEDTGTEDGSPVINELRKKLRDAEKQLAAQAERDLAFNQAKAEAVQSIVDVLGFPKLADTVIDKVDGYPTLEKVGAVLADLGLSEPQAPATEQTEGAPSADLQKVAGLGQRAATAAGAGAPVAIEEQLNQAGSREELLSAARKAGLVF